MKLENRIAILVAALVLYCSTAGLAADKDEENRPKVRPNGIQLETGVVLPENADATAFLGARLHLGNLFRNWLHFSGGVTHWGSDIEADQLPDGAGGTVSDTRIFGALQFDVFQLAGVRPYANVGFAAHLVDASTPSDPALEDAISGSYGAPEVGFGLTATAGALEFGAEVRREFADDVKNWTVGVGLGTHWGGRRKAARDKSNAKKAQAEARVIVEPPKTSSAAGGTAASLGSPSAVAAAGTKEDLRDLRRENADLRRRLDDIERKAQAQDLESARVRADSLSKANARLANELALALAAAAGQTPAANDGRPAFRVSSADETLLLIFRDSVLFGSGQATLAPGAAEPIGRVGAILEAYPGTVLLIEGHTDSRGDESQNLALSERRASAVRDALVSSGVDSTRIRTAGLGSSRPVSDNESESGRAMNRRVEIRVRPVSST